jgi:hypothetical protein
MGALATTVAHAAKTTGTDRCCPRAAWDMAYFFAGDVCAAWDTVVSPRGFADCRVFDDEALVMDAG